MKSILSLSFVMFSFFLFTHVLETANAAPSGDFRIAYVDLQKALEASQLGSVAQKEYEKEVKQMQSKIDTKKSEFKKQQEDFQKQRESLAADAKTSREEKLIALEKDLKRSFEDSQETLRRKNGMLVSDLMKKIRKVVNKVGEEEGYTIILEKSAQSVLYADTSIDITDKVVKAFDAAK